MQKRKQFSLNYETLGQLTDVNNRFHEVAFQVEEYLTALTWFLERQIKIIMQKLRKPPNMFSTKVYV